jgi:hypothetical protein
MSMAGTVTYRCESCGELITDAEAVLTPLGDDGALLPSTLAYHPEHAPQENTDGR